MYDFGSRLKETRIRRNLTQKMLAEKVNKSVSAISSYELNTQMPPLDVLISIANVLNVSLDYLAGLDNVEKYAVKDLRPKEKEVVDLLFAEFASPQKQSQDLSAAQIAIMQKLFKVFQDND